MKDLSESVVEEFASHQALVAQDESVDYNILSGDEFKALESRTYDEVIPEEVREFESALESVPLHLRSAHFPHTIE